MKCCCFVFTFAIALSAANASAIAPLSVSFVAPNVSSLAIGTPISLQIELSGLGAGDSLDYVAATIGFDGSLFTTPSIAPGSSIPDVVAFVSHVESGLADGYYDSLGSASSAQITQAGVLFSFVLTPVAAGVGTFEFQFSDALGNAAAGGGIDGLTAGAALPFAIVVPEPSALVLCGLALIAASSHRLTSSRFILSK